MQTQATRQSASAVFLVMEGSGKTEVGDTTIDWEENDVFVVPNWTWFHHRNLSATRDAVLYEITDAPLGRLRPARMIHLRVHVGIETVFIGVHDPPGVLGFFFDKADAHDGFDALEAILPRHH